MNRWKVAFFVVLASLVGTNAFWLYSAIDTGISYSYLQAGYNEQGRAIRDLGALVVAGSGNYTKADVLHLPRQAKKDAFIVEYPSEILFEQISFRFANDRLVEVGGQRER